MYAYCHFVFFIVEIVHALLYFAKRNLVYRGLLEYVVNARGSWFIMKDAPPGSSTTTIQSTKWYQYIYRGLGQQHDMYFGQIHNAYERTHCALKSV